MDVLVLALGHLPYKEDSLYVLSDYFRHHGHRLHVVESTDLNFRRAHPSWLKLLCHRMIDSDFVLCWDLDLLPWTREFDIEGCLDKDKLNLAPDTSLLFQPERFNVYFKYNGGLLGVPKSHAAFVEGIYSKFAPGNLPSFEQYYLNDEIARQSVQVHEIPVDYNCLFPRQGVPVDLWLKSRSAHYTWGIGAEKAKSIQEHKARYHTSSIGGAKPIEIIKSLDYSHVYTTACEHCILLYQECLRVEARSVLEVGAGLGISGVALGLATRHKGQSRQLTIDTEVIPATVFSSLWKAHGLTREYKRIESMDFLNSCPDTFDFIFHDADHGASVVPEYRKYWERVNPGGMLAIHDVNEIPYWEFVKSLPNTDYDFVSIDERGRMIAFIKKDGRLTHGT